jgi:L-serine dehydratase
MRTQVIDHELMRIWNTMLECMTLPYREEFFLVDWMFVVETFDVHQKFNGLINYSDHKRGSNKSDWQLIS